MTYAQVKFEIFGHIKTRKTSKALGIKPVYLVGHLAALWAWATESAPDGDLWQCEPADIAAAAQWEGNPDRFCDQLAANSWLISSPTEPTRWAINDWFKHTGKFLEQSDKAKKRKEKWLAKNVPRTFQERSESAFQERSWNVLERPILDEIREDQIRSEKKECLNPENEEPSQTALAPLGGPLALIPEVIDGSVATKPTKKAALFSEADRELARDWIAWVQETHPQIKLKEEKAADDLRKVREYLCYESFQMRALFSAIKQDDFWCHQCRSPAGLLTKSKNGFKKIDNFLNRKEIKKNAEKATVQEMIKGVKSIQEIMRDRRREANGSQNYP